MCVCVHALPLPSFLSLFRPARSVRLPAEHAAAKYTHISKQSTTTDRALSGQRGAGNRSKGEVRERQRGVHMGKQNAGKVVGQGVAGAAADSPGRAEGQIEERWWVTVTITLITEGKGEG